MVSGSAESRAVNDLGKPGAGESHARFDEGRLETGQPVSGPQRLRCSAWTAPDHERPPRQPPTLPSLERAL